MVPVRSTRRRRRRGDRAQPERPEHQDPRPYDKDLYQARHLIENFFAKLKPFWAIATRYHKPAVNFLAAVHLAAATSWLNRGLALGALRPKDWNLRATEAFAMQHRCRAGAAA